MPKVRWVLSWHLSFPSYALSTGSESMNVSNTSSSLLPTKFSQLLLLGHLHHPLLKLLIATFGMLHRVSGINESLPLSLRQPHSGTSSSSSDPPTTSPITSSSSVSPLCSSITPSFYHPRLKTHLFHKSYPRSSTSSSRAAFTRTFACTISSEIIGFCF